MRMWRGLHNIGPAPRRPEHWTDLARSIAESIEPPDSGLRRWPKDRNLRYQGAAEMRADLQRLKRDTDTGGWESPVLGRWRQHRILALSVLRSRQCHHRIRLLRFLLRLHQPRGRSLRFLELLARSFGRFWFPPPRYSSPLSSPLASTSSARVRQSH